MQLLWLDSVPAGSQSLHKNYPTMFTWERTTCGACPTVKLVEQVCLDWKDKACKELFLLWQSAWRESSSETIAMKNSKYNTAGACLKWFYAAHEVLKLILCIGASFQVLHHRRIALHVAVETLCRSIIIALNAVQLGQSFLAFPAAWPFHVDIEISGQNDEECLRRSHFLNPMSHSQTHTLKG